jgi:hypothetical protein
LHSGEECIEDTLTCQKRSLTSELLGDWATLTYRPEMAHVDFLIFAFVFENYDGLAHRVHTSRHDLLNDTRNLRGNHDSVLVEDIIFVDKTEDITSRDFISNLQAVIGLVFPFLVLIKAGDVNTTGNEN